MAHDSGLSDIGYAESDIMVGLLIAAVRDLDPPAGGAEMSLATLLNGVCEPGPLPEADVLFIPSRDTPHTDPALLEQAWRVTIFQSDARGDATALTSNSELERKVINLEIEDRWSGLAWRLRGKSGQPNSLFQRQHLKKSNKKFAKLLKEKIAATKAEAKRSGLPVIGITQLHWSAGAAEVFKELNIPYLVFVRDELQFIQSDLYRSSLEGAAAVCCAGEGLGQQVANTFNVKAIKNVRLPVDFASRFGTIEEIETTRASGLSNRIKNNDIDIPRIAIVGVTPEKGYEFYQGLLPHLANSWPEARVDVYGGGAYAEELGDFDNTTWHGHTPVSEVFSRCDVHLLTVASTGSWGRVINEAGLFGVPSVSISIGSQPEAVGEGGIIVDQVADLDAWVHALRTTYTKREQLGELARKHCGIVDHRRSIAAFRSVIKEFSS